jgi:hypothetical protein
MPRQLCRNRITNSKPQHQKPYNLEYHGAHFMPQFLLKTYTEILHVWQQELSNQLPHIELLLFFCLLMYTSFGMT